MKAVSSLAKTMSLKWILVSSILMSFLYFLRRQIPRNRVSRKNIFLTHRSCNIQIKLCVWNSLFIFVLVQQNSRFVKKVKQKRNLIKKRRKRIRWSTAQRQSQVCPLNIIIFIIYFISLNYLKTFAFCCVSYSFVINGNYWYSSFLPM